MDQATSRRSTGVRAMPRTTTDWTLCRRWRGLTGGLHRTPWMCDSLAGAPRRGLPHREGDQFGVGQPRRDPDPWGWHRRALAPSPFTRSSHSEPTARRSRGNADSGNHPRISVQLAVVEPARSPDRRPVPNDRGPGMPNAGLPVHPARHDTRHGPPVRMAGTVHEPDHRCRAGRGGSVGDASERTGRTAAGSGGRNRGGRRAFDRHRPNSELRTGTRRWTSLAGTAGSEGCRGSDERVGRAG